MNMRPFILFSVLAVTACAKPAGQVCESYGFTFGTEAFGNCMLQQQQMRMQAGAEFDQMIQHNAEMQERNSEATMQMFQRAAQPPPQTSFSTNCQTMGQLTSCTTQ